MRRRGLVIGTAVAAGAALVAITNVRYTPAEPAAPMGFAGPVRPVAIPQTKPGPAVDAPLAVPVLGYARAKLADTWGAPRSGGRGHRGMDIMAAEGTPVVATVAGRVEKLFESGRGGTTLYLRSEDGRWQYYYAHLAGYALGLQEGVAVKRGEVLGYVGDTGDAGKGNHHLHFSVARMSAGDGWWQGRDTNPYPLLAEQEPRR